METFERNTTGFTADVELYDDDNIIKIYRDYVPQEDIDREILCTRVVQNCGLLVPEYRGYIADYQGKAAPCYRSYTRREHDEAVDNRSG